MFFRSDTEPETIDLVNMELGTTNISVKNKFKIMIQIIFCKKKLVSKAPTNQVLCFSYLEIKFGFKNIIFNEKIKSSSCPLTIRVRAVRTTAERINIKSAFLLN